MAVKERLQRLWRTLAARVVLVALVVGLLLILGGAVVLDQDGEREELPLELKLAPVSELDPALLDSILERRDPTDDCVPDGQLVIPEGASADDARPLIRDPCRGPLPDWDR
jgi:hypothetical protein